MEQVSFCAFGDGDSRITSVWLRREKCGKRNEQRRALKNGAGLLANPRIGARFER